MVAANNELVEILQLEIPSGEMHPIGFLEIAGVAHHENVNSRMYAYFLDPSNYQELAALFLDSLLEIVAEKSEKAIGLESYEVITEQITPKGNRIDIVLRDSGNNRALLIENKIYHFLNNDLVDYWNCFGYSDEDQVGVLLTLYPHEIPKEVGGKFLNINHVEWIRRIQSKGLPSRLPANVYTYINDFIQTIENLTNMSTLTEQAQFYFENAKKIQLARQTYAEGVKFLTDELGILASMMGWELYGKSDEWRNIWDKQNHLHTYYTIWSGDLLNGDRTITVIIELNSNDYKHLPGMMELLKEDDDFKQLKTDGLANSQIRHFAYKVYDVNISDLEHLAHFLFERIERDFASVMKKILTHNYPNKDIPYLR